VPVPRGTIFVTDDSMRAVEATLDCTICGDDVVPIDTTTGKPLHRNGDRCCLDCYLELGSGERPMVSRRFVLLHAVAVRAHRRLQLRHPDLDLHRRGRRRAGLLGPHDGGQPGRVDPLLGLSQPADPAVSTAMTTATATQPVPHTASRTR
jgi:hypothetical protein